MSDRPVWEELKPQPLRMAQITYTLIRPWYSTYDTATRGTLYKYIKSVKSASEGCVTDE